MNNTLLLSLCIPTNGVTEWVVPVLNSIYEQHSDNSLFEVVVTDNGNSEDFMNKMEEYKEKYSNFVYKKTNAKMFLNQIESFKLASGKMIKFINHRMILLPGAIDYLINFANENVLSEPVVYFSNGQLNLDKAKKYNSFDSFVKALSYWSSWSAGITMWKKDFDKINLNNEFNSLFPHTDMLFFNRKSSEYIVDDKEILKELPCDSTKKGNYDLFNAFCVEYPSIIKRLLDDGNISLETYQFIIKENGNFVSDLYLSYVIMKKPCSYNLNGYKKAVGQYYNDIDIKIGSLILLIKKIIKKHLRV